METTRWDWKRLARPVWQAVGKPPYELAIGLLHFSRYHGYCPNPFRPVTFNEHLLAKMLWDRDPLLQVLADKVRVRDYIAQRVGAHYLTTLHHVLERAEDLRTIALPPSFMFKPTHLTREFVSIRPTDAVDREALVRRGQQWLRNSLYYAHREWAYKGMPRRLMIEELLTSSTGELYDYKMWCFGGTPRMIEVTRGRAPNRRRNLYDVEFRQLPLRIHYPHIEEPITPPPHLAEMLRIARVLSEGRDFLRVDLYNVDGRIVVGELTNYPAAGTKRFDPHEWDRRLGAYWPRHDRRGRAPGRG